MINVTPHSIDHPILLEPSQYDMLVRKTDQGWSMCSSKEEYFAKLHYLHAGFTEGKLDEAAFQDREQRLVLTWWRKGKN